MLVVNESRMCPIRYPFYLPTFLATPPSFGFPAYQFQNRATWILFSLLFRHDVVLFLSRERTHPQSQIHPEGARLPIAESRQPLTKFATIKRQNPACC